MRIRLTAAQLTPDRPARRYGPGAPTLVAPSGADRYRLLAGPAPGAERTTAWCVSEPQAIAALEELDATTGTLDRPQQIRTAAALAPHLRAPQLAALLGHRDPAEVWRWGALGRAHPKLRDAILDGKLRMTHARPLLRLPPAAQAEWAARALRGRWSVRQLTAAIRRENGPAAAEAPSSADIRALEDRVGERLGTTVKLLWPDDPAAPRSLVIDWFDVEALKGILAQLAAGPELTGQPLQVQARQLVIALQNADELSALTQHLLD